MVRACLFHGAMWSAGGQVLFLPARAVLAELVSSTSMRDKHASVGVVSCRDGVCPGYTLLSVSRTTYLIDKEGRVLHTWASRREVFVAYLLPSGNLLRDGSDLALAPQFALDIAPLRLGDLDATGAQDVAQARDTLRLARDRSSRLGGIRA